MRKEHIVPLSNVAIDLLKALPRDGTKYVFMGPKAGCPLGDSAMRKLLARMNKAITVHGFRSTFRDWCSEVAHCPREVAEMALAHLIDNKVERAYRRGNLFDRRVDLMNEWSKFCYAPVAQVLPMRRKAG